MPTSFVAPATILLLYFCQGLVSGTLSIIPTLLIDVDSRVASAVLGVLGLPLYAFTLKFLWAPVVDRFAIVSRRLHQRAQYAVAAQAVLSFVFFVLVGLWHRAGRSDEAFLRSICASSTPISGDGRTVFTGEGHCASAWNASVLLYTALLFALALSSATQDVAVDAWAVECLSEADSGQEGADSSLAGILQMLGLVAGSSATQVFLLYRDPIHETVHMGHFFALCGATCVVGCISACILPFLLRESSAVGTSSDRSGADEGSAVLSTVSTSLVSIARDASSRRFVAVLLTRGWSSAVAAVQTQLLQISGLVDAPFLARTRVLTTAAAVATAMLLSSRVVARWGSALLLRWNSRFDFAAAAASIVLFAFIFHVEFDRAKAPPTNELLWSKDWYLTVVVAMSLVSAAVSAVSFVSVVDMSARLARTYHTRHAATAITVFNAMANLGYTLPSSLVMFAFDPLASQFRSTDVSGSDAATRRWALVWVVAPSIFFIAFIARRVLLVPSAVALAAECRQDGAASTTSTVGSKKQK